MAKHVMEAMGMSRVVIIDGKVVEVSEPRVRYCPLFHKHRGIEEIDADVVRNNIEFRIKDFGMCAPSRKMRMRDFLSFGVSELLGMSVSKGLLDCAVIACDGAGTVIIDEPEMIQGIGGRISGLVETSPISEVIDAVGVNRVLDPLTAKMDMFLGAMRAEAMGYQRIGVTVALAKDAERIRHELGSSAVIFAVHTSGLSEQDARSMFDHCDIVTACASKAVRAEAERRGVMKVGNKVPIFAITEIGRKILETRLEQIGYVQPEGADDPPRPLI